MASLSQRARATAAPQNSSYLDGLNDKQAEAVLTTEGPVLMLAGAGTGKTKALTTRIAHLLAAGKAQPWEVLAVTFTNKAAREMKERVGALVGEVVEGLRWMGTFHSVAAQILRRHAEIVGLKPSFTIIDTDDQVRLCKQVIESSGLDEKRWSGRGMAAVIDGWKNKGLTPADLKAHDGDVFGDGKAVSLYRDYQQRLIDLNAADFGDLLVHNLTIFQREPEIRAEYHRRFRYMLVDEYQDTNVAQYLWLRLLAQGKEGDPANICVVGDDDQSIYGWRGAEVENILRFEKDFPGAKVIRLEQNYRSTQAILNAAGAIISNNTDRLGKDLWTEQEGGELIKLRGVWDGEEEARQIAEDIESEQMKGRSLSDMAVLVRASFQMRSFEERFNTQGIAYRVVGGPRFYEREETRDALAYLRLVRNAEDDLSFSRIINKPRRGFGDKTLQQLNVIARQNRMSLVAAGQLMLETNELKGKAKAAMGTFLASLQRWQNEAEAMAPAPLAEMVLEEAGYTDYWKNSKNVQAPSKLENLKELVNAASEFETLAGYLDHVSLVAERSEESEDGQVWLMTLHAAKGLEYPVVFLPGWEEEIFPSKRSLDENGKVGLEEERRLAYVGITRARESCRISFAANRQVYGRWQNALPSRFVDELPEEEVDVISEPGLYGVSAKDTPAQSRFADLVLEDSANRYQTPGWKRAREYGQRRVSEPAIDGHARLVASSAPGEETFSAGERVRHAKFGEGTVLRAEGNKLEVEFDDVGDKKVIASFLELAE
ncbi:UvrD-helicase domain-containing protein [Parvularcula sp. ZS-1/3]|uniref:DNA 3'-5' helicase n=1 Tax=Parvularcula mediterranea TaxID=2732508 RepID=A0A7Y3W5B3_9PROT|nr:UvrD-helicase domain-containing protein [Parvularcula mediterranea]NNU16343.1 UvrD-helicase domain-containing protein [Parvularcula mediterranea]